MVDTHDVTDLNVYNADPASTLSYQDLFTYSNTPCPVALCSSAVADYLDNISMLTYANYGNGAAYVIQTLGHLQYKRNRPFKFKIEVTCHNNFNRATSMAVAFEISCHITSTTISTTTPALQTYDMILGTFHAFTFPKFDTTEPNCAITYTITLSAGNTAMATDLTNTDALGPMTAYLSGVAGTDVNEGEYLFTVTAIADGGSTFTTPEWTLKVACGLLNADAPLSPAAGTVVSFALPIADASLVYFEISGVYNSLAYNCPIKKIMYESADDVASALYFGAAAPSPITGSNTTFRAIPIDITT